MSPGSTRESGCSLIRSHIERKVFELASRAALIGKVLAASNG
jgi:hypothetical protein